MNTPEALPNPSTTIASDSLLPALDRRGFIKTAALTSAIVGAITPWTASAAGPTPSAKTAASGGVVPLAPPDRQPDDLKIPTPPPRKMGWAIVGLGTLALDEILPAFRECELSQPVALVSGHPEKARQVAATYGIDEKAIYTYDTYDELAKNPAVDIIYIVLPNSMHAEYTQRGVQAGKHVFCEKPIAVTVAQSEEMIAVAKKTGKKLGVAYRLHHEPMNQKVMELCQSKKLGKVKLFTSNNCQTTQAPNIRLSRETGGGPIGDVGVYSINAARYCIGEEPIEVCAMGQQPTDDPNFREVPESVSYLLRFPSGAIANCTCSFGTARSSSYEVICEKGTIRMDPAFTYDGLRLVVTEQMLATEWNLPAVNQFTQEIDAFSKSVLDNTPFATPGEEGLADMRIVTALTEAWQKGGWVKIG